MKVGGKGPAQATWSFPPRRLSLFGEPSGLVECSLKVINHLRTPGTSEVGGRGGNGRRQRRPPAEGAGTDDERGGCGGGGGSRLPSTKCGDDQRGAETPENGGGLQTGRQSVPGMGLIYEIGQDTGDPHGRPDVSEKIAETGACRLVIRGGRDGC